MKDLSGTLWRRNMADTFQSDVMTARYGIARMQNNDDEPRVARSSDCEHRGLWSTTKVLNDARGMAHGESAR